MQENQMTTNVTNQSNVNGESANQQVVVTPEMTKLEYGDEIKKMIHTAGTLELTQEQNSVLYSDPNDEDIYIIPDGKIYMSWTKYAERLNKAFGGTGWALVPEGMPKSHNGTIYWPHHLVIKGIYIGTAIGEQQLANNQMTYGEACEGAKSNALMRCCKNMGIGIKLWDKVFVNYWLDKYATYRWEENKNTGKNKKVWSLKPNAFDSIIAQRNANKTQAPQTTNTNVSANVSNNVSNNVEKKEVKNNWDEEVTFEEIKDDEIKPKIKKATKNVKSDSTKESPKESPKESKQPQTNAETNGNSERVMKILADFQSMNSVEDLKTYFDNLRQNRYDKEKFTTLEIEICRRAGSDRYLKLVTAKK